MESPLIFHIDVNNAFLSWESIERLKEAKEQGQNTVDLRKIAAVIGGDEQSRHGIVLAKSPLAKSFGIVTAETLNEARKKCPGLTIVPPRMFCYREHSKELMGLLRKYSNVLEQFSIDEAFLDMTGRTRELGSPKETANTIREEVNRQLGFTVNVGVSTNKLLAKMASDFQKPDRVHTLFPYEIQEKMWPLPVRELFFVGKASEKKLFNLGIRTIGDLAKTDGSIIRSHMGKYGEMIHDYANGIDNSPVQNNREEAKGYSNETTLSRDLTDSAQAKKHLRKLCESVGSRLRKDKKIAGVVAISIKTHDFISRSHQCTLYDPTDNTDVLYQYACDLFDDFWDGTPIRLIGVATSKITSQEGRQLNLFDMEPFAENTK